MNRTLELHDRVGQAGTQVAETGASPSPSDRWYLEWLEPGVIVDLLGAIVALAAVWVAARQSSRWMKEFRYRRDHDVARAANHAVSEWIQCVRWARRPLRTDPAGQPPTAGVRADLTEAARLAGEAEKAISAAAVVWGPDDADLQTTRDSIRDAMAKLSTALLALEGDGDSEDRRAARPIVYASQATITKGQDAIEPLLETARGSIERATRELLGRRSKPR